MNLSELASFCAVYDDSRRRVRKSTEETYHLTIKRMIAFFGDIPVDGLTLKSLSEWQTHLESLELSITHQNNFKRRARTMLNFSREHGFNIPPFPAKFWRMRKVHKTVKSINQHNKIKMLASSGIRDTAMLLLAAESGRRRGGLADLQIKNIRIWHNEEHGWRMIARVREKGDTPQLMFATDTAVMALNVWLDLRAKLLESMGVEDHGYVFISYTTGRPLHDASLTRLATAVKRVADIVESEPANLHAFRHRAAKDMLAEGMTLPEVRDILGHADAATTANMYVINDEDEIAAAFFQKRNKKK